MQSITLHKNSKMFKFFICLSAFVALAFSASLSEPQVIPIVSQSNEAEPDGSSFKWAFESGDGTSQHQSGQVVPVDKDSAVESVQGGASYVDPEGNKHDISYVADENGYQPQGADIPVPPPIPSQIQKSLEYQAAHPEVVA